MFLVVKLYSLFYQTFSNYVSLATVHSFIYKGVKTGTVRVMNQKGRNKVDGHQEELAIAYIVQAYKVRLHDVCDVIAFCGLKL